MDNTQSPDPDNFKSYSDLFPDIIPLEHRRGSCITCELNPTEHYKWSYFRISGQNAEHDNRIYVAGRFDYDKFPQTEGFVSDVLLPFIKFELLMMRRAFRSQLVNRLDRGNDCIYIYSADTSILNDVTSKAFREQVLKPVV
jgi:hypothetical protein